MITTIVLIKTKHSKINEVGEKISAIKGVTEVYSVSGRYNLLAIIRHKEMDDISVIVTEKINAVEGIKKTESMIAYRMLSKYDLAGVFDLGD
ncbi:Lrp/AsnC ligand binding domain-containing protein [Maribellus sp. YY47]|uniref:Lrp/AsnC family transcriptional regulator n=1 Tax=Maribellus sp. YY47 TaxID=2929486 RepID=UPI0020010E6F|nr:Lrp/AsnC ligand binding domain-containing protein [Maribellus sp. YY47]MCK3685273.1 Lrp/AsnC ligand binding domain-containing protein [Maribellus sp. YY47]